MSLVLTPEVIVQVSDLLDANLVIFIEIVELMNIAPGNGQ